MTAPDPAFSDCPRETDAAQVRLEAIYWKIVELRPSFPGAPLIHVRPDWREHPSPSGPAADLFQRHLRSAKSVLDVGAGNQYWKDVLVRLGINATYQSADIEPTHHHDFIDFLDVTSEFDAILMLELIEHLDVEVGLSFLKHASKLLHPGGVLVIGTPNPAHSHWMWSIDLTHIRPWPAHDLWSALQLFGFKDVQVYRQTFTSSRRRLILPLQRGVAKLLQLDPAHTLLVFARKPSEN